MQFVLHASIVVVQNNAVLLVQEGKPQAYKQWNFPGGHVEPGEDIARAAERETLEETGLQVRADELIGIYTGIGNDHYIHFVFTGTAYDGALSPLLYEILDCRFFSFAELQAMPDHALLNPRKLHTIIQHYRQGIRYPLEILCFP